MADELFIRQIAALCQRFGPQYGILVNSPIIAQAILESGHGQSELAMNAHNYFGIKYKLKSNGSKRCPTALDEPYIKVGSEQNPDGSYNSYEMQWFKFPNMESGVKGYYDFINVSTYANLKGVKSPDEYCRLIKQDGYATSTNYAQNLMTVIENYNLMQYDNIQNEEKIMLRLALGAGHYLGTPGKGCLKSIDPNKTKEWVLNDRICDYVEGLLAFYDGVEICRMDDTTGQHDVPLENRKAMSSEFGADIYISVHHNAGINGGAGGGTMVFHYNTAINKAQAQRIYDAIVNRTGLRGNRSTPVANGNHLYECYAPTMASYIIENGFMDSTTDTPIILTDEHARKTAQGIVDFLVAEYNLVKKAPEPEMPNFVAVTELTYEEPVLLSSDTVAALAQQYGLTEEQLASNNPGLYKLATNTYIINKNTVIYVGK